MSEPEKNKTAFRVGADIHEKLDYLLEKVKELLGEGSDKPSEDEPQPVNEDNQQ